MVPVEVRDAIRDFREADIGLTTTVGLAGFHLNGATLSLSAEIGRWPRAEQPRLGATQQPLDIAGAVLVRAERWQQRILVSIARAIAAGYTVTRAYDVAAAVKLSHIAQLQKYLGIASDADAEKMRKAVDDALLPNAREKIVEEILKAGAGLLSIGLETLLPATKIALIIYELQKNIREATRGPARNDVDELFELRSQVRLSLNTSREARNLLTTIVETDLTKLPD